MNGNRRTFIRLPKYSLEKDSETFLSEHILHWTSWLTNTKRETDHSSWNIPTDMMLLALNLIAEM